ncbi:MAG: TetR/AcrR family transcriptional regulator [Vulcanibacillus sp.]
MNETIVEQEILNAAKKNFIEKGKSGARMQDIANEAGVNKALLHYYFRSKDMLFQKVYQDAIKDLGDSVYTISQRTNSVEELLKIVIDRTFTFQLGNENFLLFFFWEAKTEKYNVANIAKNSQNILGFCPFDVFSPKIEKAIELGEIRKLDPNELIINVLSLIISFFLALPIIKSTFELTEELFENMIESRKNEIFRLIWNDIKIK